MSSFSQTDTTKPQTNIPVVQSDTTKIRIKTPVAKLAIKDILKGDGCEVELKLTQEKLIKTEEREKEKGQSYRKRRRRPRRSQRRRRQRCPG